MPFCQSGDKSAYYEWLIHDAILMELSASHPKMTIFEEAELKRRLLKIIEANVDLHEPGQLMQLFRQAMDRRISEPESTL
jgi:hypothetical protein